MRRLRQGTVGAAPEACRLRLRLRPIILTSVAFIAGATAALANGARDHRPGAGGGVWRLLLAMTIEG